jgi:F0F1-type ATP synthase membrane subunit b/b'
MMPGMASLPLWAQVIFWVVFALLGLSVSLVVYWVRRYIDGKDEREKKLDNKLNFHENKFNQITNELKEVSEKLKSESAEELKQIRREVIQTHVIASEAKNTLQFIGEKIGEVKKEIEKIYHSSTVHSDQISKTAVALAKHEVEIQTVKKRIDENTVIISEIRKKKA